MRAPVPALLLLALVLAACPRWQSSRVPPPSLEHRWQRAQQQWQSPGLSAGYAAWASLDPATAQGQEAHHRLATAAGHYQRAVTLIQTGQPGGRQELQRGKAVAPMDPALFLPLARACRAQDNAFLALQYYRSYLGSSAASGLEAAAARQELAELAREFGELWEGSAPERPSPGSVISKVPPAAILFIGTAFGLLLAVALSNLGARRRRGRSLAELAQAYPELQPALAYLIGRLRHELLKHRIGAAADVAHALAAGQSSAELRVFLHRRLYGGERLDEAWSGYLQSFRRALGPDFDLARHRTFASAERAIKQLQTLELPLLRGERAAVRKLVAAHKRLEAFDRGLAELVGRMQRTSLDSELFTQAMQAVRSEPLAGQVPLDTVELIGPTEPVFVAVYRTDLMLILKNLLRNAILAVGRAPPPRQIAADVLVELLPTGEELVLLRVHDTSPEPLTPEQIYRSSDAEAAGAQRGLGLVTAALSLYSGSISVEPGRSGYRKCVAVHLFRTLEAAEHNVGPEDEAAFGH